MYNGIGKVLILAMRERFLAIVALCACLATTPVAKADYGQNSAVFANVECWLNVAIPGVTADNDLISGTNTLYACSAGAKDLATSTTYDNGQFFRAELKMNGEVVYLREYEVDPGGGGGSFGSLSFGWEGMEYGQAHQPPGVRFASNHFDHNAVVTIELKADYALFKNGVWVETGSVTTVIKPKAYNKLASWMTTVDQNNDPLLQMFIAEIESYMNVTRTKFAEAKYEIDADLHDWIQSDALAEIEDATATSVNSHGNPTMIATSGAITSDNHRLTWAEIGATTSDAPPGPVTPPHSFVILWCCATFDSVAQIKGAFRLNELAGLDRAVFGFSEVASWDCWDQANNTMVGCDKFIIEFFAQLNAGYDVNKALATANSKYTPLALAGQDLPMLLSGDGYTTH